MQNFPASPQNATLLTVLRLWWSRRQIEARRRHALAQLAGLSQDQLEDLGYPRLSFGVGDQSRAALWLSALPWMRRSL
ncbi:MAG: hypothetical protein ACPGNV_10935 [Mangrovicoccus sp.]